MAPSASCFVGAPLYFIVPPSSICIGRFENYVKKRNMKRLFLVERRGCLRAGRNSPYSVQNF